MTHGVHEPDLAEIFEAFARKAVADFPQLRGRFSLYSEPTNTHHGSFDNEDIRRRLLQKQCELAFEHRAEAGRPFAVQTDVGYLITYPGTSDDYSRRFYTKPGTPYAEEMEIKGDHELAHLIAPGGYLDEDRCENIAEAFALLRRLQKNGTIREAIDISIKNTVNNFILLGETSHFYLPVLQQLGRLSASRNLTGLTPLQTANMAYRLSYLYAPSGKDIRELEKIFAPLMPGSNKTREQLVDDCATIMLGEHGPHSDTVFDMGRIFLQPVLHERPDINNMIRNHVRLKRHAYPEQRLAYEVKDMMVLGRFDKTPGSLIDPDAYQSMQNLRYLQRAADVYGAIRYFQATGKDIPHKHIKPVSIAAVGRLRGLNVASLEQRRAILLARKIAADPALKARAVKASRSPHAP